MTPRHRLLQRQLRRLGLGDAPPTAEQWAAFVAAVDDTYEDADRDRVTLERSLTLSSREMRALYDDLRRATEHELATEHAKLRAATAVQGAVLESSPNGLVVVDLENRIRLANRRFFELWGLAPIGLEDGYVPGAVRGQVAALMCDPSAFQSAIGDLVRDAVTTRTLEAPLVDGRTMEIESVPALDTTGAPYGRLWIFRDITARRVAEARLREAHAFLDILVDAIPHMIAVRDVPDGGRVVRLNGGGERVLGRARQDVVGRTVAEVMPDHADAILASDRAALEHAGVLVLDEMLPTAAGMRWLRTSKTAIRVDDGPPRYVLCVSEDITEARAQNAELLLAKDRAEAAVRVKSDFLLNMSHELRTPLNAILGFARVVQRSARARLTEDERDHLLDVERAGDHMLQLINDLLDLRSIETIRVSLGPVELLPPLDEAARMVAPLVRERGHTLTVDLAGDLPPCLGSARAITQVAVNLLSNAAKYTPEHGRIALRAERDGSIITIAVSDNGVGIAPEDQRRLFVYFEQLGAKHQNHMKGSGVGLALTRALVEQMGGAITVTSAPGVGSTFAVRLQVAPIRGAS